MGNSKPISTAHCKDESKQWSRVRNRTPRERPGRLGKGEEARRESLRHVGRDTHYAGTSPNVQYFPRGPFWGPGRKVEPATHEVLHNDMFKVLAVLLIRVVGIQVSCGLGCQCWPSPPHAKDKK